MKPGIVSWNPLVKLALVSGLAPTPLMSAFWGMGLSRSLIAAVRLGIFEAVEEKERTAADIAIAAGCDGNAVIPLLDSLVGFGYLKRRRGRYSLSRESRRWLLRSSRGSLREGLMMLGDLFASVEPIEDRIRSGKATNFHHRGLPEETWAHYIRGLGHFARYLGPEIAKKVPVDRTPERLLDVGGGHGLYSAAMCRRFPGLRCEVLDLPEAVRQGSLLVAEEGYSDRIVFREGDLRSTAWRDGFDIVLMMNILHNLTGPECAEALLHARGALRTGGTLFIVDSEHENEDGGSLSAVAGFNELFFFLVSGGTAWPEETMRGWLSRSSFEKIKRTRSILLPGLLVLSAVAGGGEPRR